ncbi:MULTISPECIES: complement regulator-acquiring protein [Borreliella]|uniref:Outer surface protein n=14 Tax=Borreliella TaxID=64895 RepID=C0R898_BORVA|nr:complement regulator-acquiring protein [Borreliella valaisiana]ACN52693.1 outer surface protein [Borreliella valaisiana VS116]AIJ30224.1 lipoprotein [Borreliella valaisiana Tom4006]WKC76662.1 complement regulator-acquiring protein [Borreliella valaisiana]WVN14677.1 complement regulator-acquiring protein [Borreliella valaisiana]
MKIKSLMHLKFIVLLLFSCTVDAHLNEDYKTKVEELLNNTTNDQATISINTKPNATQNSTNANKVTNLQKQPQVANKQPQILQNQASPASQANLEQLLKQVNSPQGSLKNGQAKIQVTPPKQIAPPAAPTQSVKNVTKGTKTTIKTPSKRIQKLPRQKSAFNYDLSQSTNYTNFSLQQNNNSPTTYDKVQLSFSQASLSNHSQTLKNKLIRKIFAEKTKTNNSNGFRETYDQFKMKDSAFDLLDVISNTLVYDRSYAPQLNSNTPEAENERYKFYAILNFDQSKTKKFGSIMEILYAENQNHNLIRSLIISGLGIQISFELALEEIEKKIELFTQELLNNTIDGFNFDIKMQELSFKLNEILAERKEWSKHVDTLIANVNSNESLKNPQSLAQYIENRYLDKMQNARQTVLDLYLKITEFK